MFRMMDTGDGRRATGNVDEQRYVAEHVVEDLSVHAVMEEEILYPAMREVLPDGDRLVDEALQEHQEAKELLTRIDGKDPQSEDARRAFDEWWVPIEHHVEEEEGELSRLRGALGQERLQQMGQPAKRRRPIRIRMHPTRLPATSPPGRLLPSSTTCATRCGTEGQDENGSRRSLRRHAGGRLIERVSAKLSPGCRPKPSKRQGRERWARGDLNSDSRRFDRCWSMSESGPDQHFLRSAC